MEFCDEHRQKAFEIKIVVFRKMFEIAQDLEVDEEESKKHFFLCTCIRSIQK